MAEWSTVLQLLNLPIVGGVLYVAVRIGVAMQKLQDHERRLEDIEGRMWGRRSEAG